LQSFYTECIITSQPVINMKCTNKQKERTVGDNETFVSLMRVAQEDANISKVIVGILAQSPFNRKSMLNTLIAEMKLKSAPVDFIQAIASLLDDDVADKVARLLKDIDDQHSNPDDGSKPLRV
jgi:hypothetical protein